MILRLIDIACGIALGSAVITVVVGQVPRSIAEGLGSLSLMFSIMLLLGALAIVVGAAFRGHDQATKRAQLALGAEYAGWLMIGIASLIYMGAVIIQFGYLRSALSISFSGAFGLIALGRWWLIQKSINTARRADREP